MGANFVEVFKGAIDQLEVDAKKVGLTLTSICRATKISRATPDRWRKTPPTTVDLLAKMQKVVTDKAAKDAAAAKDMHHD